MKRLYWQHVHVGDIHHQLDDADTKHHGGRFELVATNPRFAEFFEISMDPDRQNEDAEHADLWDLDGWGIVHEDGRSESIFPPEVSLDEDSIWWSPR